MYLAKCWRDARLSVAIFAVPIVIELYQMLRHPGSGIVIGDHASLEWMATRFLSISGALLLFVGWSLGGDGIGHEIAEDKGAYLLTRPRSRWFFVWSDSGFAFALLAALAWVIVLFFELITVTHLVRLPQGMTLSASVMMLVPLCGLVFAGLVYGVTYLCTMVIPRHNTARVVSIAVLIGYAYLHFKSRGWYGIAHDLFPSWWVDPFPDKFNSAAAPHLWLELGARLLVIGLLLLAAQFVLERREIRA